MVMLFRWHRSCLHGAHDNMLMTTRQIKRLINETLLLEVSFEQAKQSLWSNNTRKIVKGWYFDRQVRMLGVDADVVRDIFRTNPADFEYQINNRLKRYHAQILNLLPDDISDGQKGQALLWLINLSRNDKAFLDYLLYGSDALDAHQAPHDLEKFFLWQQFMEPNDLNVIKSLQQLGSVVDNARDAIEEYLKNKQYHDADEGTEKLFEDDQWFIAAIHNKGAACELGKNTQWCTAAPGLDFFEQYYSSDDPLIFVYDKQANDKYQLHFGTQQFMDEDDNPISTAKLIELTDSLLMIEQYGINKKFARTVVLLDDVDPSTLERLAHFADVDVRLRVAGHKNTRVDTIKSLLNDENRRVIANARIELRRRGLV